MLKKIFIIIFVYKAINAIEPTANCVENFDGSKFYGCKLQSFNDIQNFTKFKLTINHEPGFQNNNVERISGSSLTISSFPTGVFNYFKDIIDFKITASQISKMDDPFFNCAKLQILNMNSNRLTIIKKGIFNECKSFQNIFLPFNRITTVEDDAFSGLINLQYIILQSNDFLIKLKKGAFDGLYSLEYLNFEYNLIEFIEEKVFYGTDELNLLMLNGNRLVSLNSASFSLLPNLKILEVNNNPIKAVSYDFFDKFPALTTLKIEGANCINNEFAEITAEVVKRFNQCFAEIVYCNNFNNICVLNQFIIDSDKKVFIEHLSKQFAVTHLTVSENFTMKSIYLGIFDSFTQLQIVNFSNVGLENMSNLKNCERCENIEKIILNDNKLSLDSTIDFSPFSKLTKVSMQRNGYKTFGSSNFKSNTVMSLNLSKNKISSMFINDNEMKNLIILDLTDNNISTLKGFSFGNMNKIKELYLDYNSLRILYKDSFNELINLEILSITHNVLKVIEREAFTELDKLKVLNLDGNDLQSLSTDEFGGKLPQSLELISANNNSLFGISRKFVESLSNETIFNAMNNPCSTLQDFSNCIELPQILCDFVYENQLYTCRIISARVVGTDYTYFITGEHKGSSTNINVSVLIADNIIDPIIENYKDSSKKHTKKPHSFYKNNPKEICLEHPHLKSITFDGMGLQDLNDFSNCVELRYVSLERNRLISISNTVFKGCLFIEYINLENNMISTLGNFMSPLNNLLFFNFGNNEMERIPATFFITIHL
ncbi:hypothetical protein PVAND_003468 [Polypedilum vanderplanki]|uniref:Uncharacterized protein n=1 Tax=Polypedilum vanderplanki TaxID=319348 RepID=A0A9J6BV67_POLVA|nr:hypothetical protein PVAND_003468 [Polypedilum vanderplanki]